MMDDRALGVARTAPGPIVVPPGARVLIVDDRQANTAVLERMLHTAGVADVHSLTDPREAVARYLELAPDLVLLDLHMPNLDGFEVLARLRAAVPPEEFLPVVVLTADTTTGARDRALEGGAKDFLTKPLDYTEVILRVRNLLETHTLYADARRHAAALQADLDTRAERERALAREQATRVGRVDVALSPGSLHMVFQPIAELHTGRLVGVEALARFECEPRRPPNEWFDEAATVGRQRELELAAASAALTHLDLIPTDAFLSVNVSPATAQSTELAGLLDRTDAARVVLELTEHARVEDYPALLAALATLRHRGVRVAVDDAGSGYAGLEHILLLCPDILKLDTTLTRGIDTDLARRALATALVTFADQIDSQIIAEGIETHDELRVLRDLNIGWGQGYHLARPGPLQALTTNLAI